MKRRFGFSLAEMMIVMLVVAIVLAATAPMITRKVSRERSDKVFDMLNIDPTNAVEYLKGRNQRIFMNAKPDGYVGIRETGKTIPKNSVIFGYSKYGILPITPSGESSPTAFVGIGFNTDNKANSVAIGYDVSAGKNSVAIGYKSKNDADTFLSANYSLALGSNATTIGSNSIAIGHNASTNMKSSLAIGYGATANQNSIAIGYNAVSSGSYSTAIGYNASVSKAHSIVLGTEEDTVYIPGNLIVGKITAVGVKAATDHKKYPLYAMAHHSHDGDDRHFTDIVDVVERNHADDYKGNKDWAMVMYGQHKPGVQVGPYIFLTHSWSSGYGDNQKICPPSPWGDWNRIQNGDCNIVDTTHNNPLLYSDARLKNVGEAFNGGLEELNKLNVYHFTFKNDKEKTPHVGVIAQDLQKVFPDAVTQGKDGYLLIRWDEMFYSALNAIKELNTKIVSITENLQNITKDIVYLKEKTEQQQITIDAQEKLLKAQQTEIEKLSAKIEKLEHKK